MASLVALIFGVAIGLVADAQDVVTSQELFAKVSARFATVRDYSCDFRITMGETVSRGRLYFQAPNLLRLDFSEPPDQVLLSDGKKLVVYVPSKGILLSQRLATQAQPNATTQSPTPQGLRMLADSYDVAYLDSPTPQLLDDRSKEMVTKFRLTRRSALEMHREIVLSVSAELLIRRWESTLEDRSQMVRDTVNPGG